MMMAWCSCRARRRRSCWNPAWRGSPPKAVGGDHGHGRVDHRDIQSSDSAHDVTAPSRGPVLAVIVVASHAFAVDAEIAATNTDHDALRHCPFSPPLIAPSHRNNRQSNDAPKPAEWLEDQLPVAVKFLFATVLNSRLVVAASGLRSLSDQDFWTGTVPNPKRKSVHSAAKKLLGMPGSSLADSSPRPAWKTGTGPGGRLESDDSAARWRARDRSGAAGLRLSRVLWPIPAARAESGVRLLAVHFLTVQLVHSRSRPLSDVLLLERPTTGSAWR